MPQFGNWEVNKDGIRWIGEFDYLIPKDNLGDPMSIKGETDQMFDTLLHMTEKTWLTEADLYTLNTAFVFAIDHLGIEHSPHLNFAKTFEEQQRLYKEYSKDEDDGLGL